MIDPKIQEMQMQQAQGVDPLSQTQQSSVMLGGPGIDVIPPQVGLGETQPQQKLMKSLFEQEKELEPQAKLVEALKKLNVDPTGIGLSKLGKFNLVSKLQKRHGENYSQITGVRDVLSMFDKFLDSTDGRLSEAKQMSMADRTLSALGKV